MESQGSCGDVLEDDAGHSKGKGQIEFRADSDFGDSVLILVLGDKHSVVEGTLSSDVSEDGLSY